MLHMEERRAVLNAEEQAVMDHISAAMAGIQGPLGLREIDGQYVNINELVVAVHTLQSFVIQHMLQRIEPDKWGKWFE